MNLLKSLAAVSSMTMFSRVLGFARDAIVARIFGAGMATDAFFVAFKLPNLLRRIFAEGAFSQAFVPILAEYKSKQGEDATRVFVSYVSGLLTLALAVVTVAGMLAAPWVIMVTAPGFADTADKFALTSQLLKITFPYILLISLASLVGAILNTWNRFSIPAFAPTLLNFSMICFALFAAPYFNPPVLALAWAVTVGGILQLVYQLPHLKKIGMLVLPRINFHDAGAMRVVKQMGPAILGVSVSQISLIINTIFASFLASGSVSWMYTPTWKVIFNGCGWSGQICQQCQRSQARSPRSPTVQQACQRPSQPPAQVSAGQKRQETKTRAWRLHPALLFRQNRRYKMHGKMPLRQVRRNKF